MKLLHIAAAAALGVATLGGPASAAVIVTKKVVRAGPGPRVFAPRRPFVRPLVRRPLVVRPLRRF